METIDKPAEVPIEIARGKLGDYVRLAQLANRTTVLTFHGKPAALIVPIPSEGDAGWAERAATP